jgi:hypothetical protein
MRGAVSSHIACLSLVLAASCYGSKREVTDIDVLVICDDLAKSRTALKDLDLGGFDNCCGAEIKTV